MKFKNQLELPLTSIDAKEKSILRLLIQIAEIPSPTGFERKKNNFLKNKLDKLGFKESRIDKVGNCILEIPAIISSNQKKTILIVAHADTACDPGEKHKITQDKKYLYGHSICDNSAGITGLLITLSLIRDYRITFPNNIIVVFTVGEEGLGAKRGMKEVMKTYGKRINAVINVESHNIGRVTNQVIAQFRCLIGVSTKQGGHSFRDFGLPNANVILARIISDFSKSKIRQIGGKTTFNVAQLKSEGTINSIPTDASALFEIRSENKASFKSTKNKFLSIVNRYKKMFPQATITIDKYADVDVVGFPKTHKLYKLIIDVQKTLGIESKIDSGNTDGDVSLAMGIPTVTIGTSIGFNTHSLSEYMEKKSIILGIKQVFLTVNSVMNNI